MFRAEILTLFPEVIRAYTTASILGKGQERGHLELLARDIRDFAVGKHKATDDSPYGGGAGMVMRVEPLQGAIAAAKANLPDALVLLMSPRGKTFSQVEARRLHALDRPLILICGRYEGVDERVMSLVDEELSLGDFVLTGGELAALCVVDAISRLVPGVLGNDASAGADSFEQGVLEHPHYTRPPEFEGRAVPEILQCGDHARIARWRRYKSLVATRERRPDLFDRLTLSRADQKLLAMTEDDL